MRPSDAGRVFCDAESFSAVRELVGSEYEVVDGVYCFPARLLVEVPLALLDTRYLDRFHVLSDPNRVGSDIAPERVLFDQISSEYDRDIDEDNNIRTASHLLSIIEGSRVLDFACGTGLSLRSPLAAGKEVVGIDSSAGMLEIARAAGMRTATLSDLGGLGDSTFDGLIASYALHLHGPRVELANALHLIRVGGRIAANFHKRSGYAEVAEHLADRGFRLRSALSPVEGLASPVAIWERLE